MTTIPQTTVETFWKRGYAVLRGLFSAEEVAALREDVMASLAEREAGIAPPRDLLSDPHLCRVVRDQRLVGAARELLGGQPVYFGDGSYAVLGHGYEEGRDVGGYHRDNTDRSNLDAPDWQGRYSLIRFGVYLQDHSRHSGGLMVRTGSHDAIQHGWRNYLYDRYLDTAAGDVGVWSMRIQHAGVGRGWRLFPALGIPPQLQGVVPGWLQLPRWDRERAAVWVSYALDDHHLARHLEYLYGRAERLHMWRHSVWPADEIAACEAARLGVVDAPARLRELLAEGAEVGTHVKHYQLPY